MNPQTYEPSDLRRMARVAQHRAQLCDAPLGYWVRVEDTGATLVVRGVSRVDGQAKTVERKL